MRRRQLPGILLLAMALCLPAARRAEGRAPTERELSLFRQGNAAYEAGNFTAAAEAYEGILRTGLASRDVYYNLANARLKEGRLGPAILNYRRALRLDPADEDARANLEYARRRTQDATPTEVPDPLPWLSALNPGARRAGWIYLVILNLAALFFAGRRFLRRPPAFLQHLFAVTAVLAVLGGLLFFFEARAESQRVEAVVMEPVADARSGPGQDYTVAFVVHEGTEVTLGRATGGWVEVSITPELKGWVPGTAVEKVQ